MVADPVLVAAPAAVVDPVSTAQAMSPAAAGFKADLDAALADAPVGQRASIASFFASRQFAPFWTAPDTDRAAVLIAALENSGAQGLVPRRYGAGSLSMAFDAPEGSDGAREVAAMTAYLRYASDLSSGMLDPSVINSEITRKPQKPAPALLLARLDTEPLPDVLASLEPTDPDYRRLVDEKLRLESLVQTASWGPEVPDGPTLHPGETGPRISELRMRLARLGYIAPSGEAADPRFDDTLTQAVERFQSDYGLAADGVVGSMTLSAINAPTATRLAQVVVNLERMRWMPHDLGERYLFVNIPDFTVRLIDGGETTWQSKVVVGKAHVTETPEFSGVVSYMVVNPTWHIPDSIAIRDYLPKLQRDPMVLKRQNIRLLTRGGTEINPKLVDFTQYTPENFPFRIKQRPNDDNALGQVKFMFPNEHSVYMHDTPHKELFPRDVRAFSNGCIRLEKPVELAEILLTGQVSDPAASYQEIVATKKERRVNLDRSIPVHIVYRSVWFDEGGEVRYRADVYGRDAQVLEALEAAGVTLPAVQG
jgi:murein L,D-transpeptidase YcbB/YkuD